MLSSFMKRREILVRALHVLVAAAAGAAAVIGLPKGPVIAVVMVACAAIEGWRWWRDKHAPETPPPIDEQVRNARRWPWQCAWPFLTVIGLVALGAVGRARGMSWSLVGLFCGFGLTFALYFFFTQIESARMWRSGRKKRGPLVRDWTLLAVSGFFCVAGLFGVWRSPEDRKLWAALAFFALCTLVAVEIVLTKLRRERFEAMRVEVVGGVPIRFAVARFVVLGVGMTVVAGTMSFAPVPALARVCAAVVGVAAIWLLGAIATGHIGRRFIQFDPAGLTVSEGSFQYQVAWDSILDLAEYEFADNPVVGFNIAGLEEAMAMQTEKARRASTPMVNGFVPSGVHVTPAERSLKAMKRLVSNRRSLRRHVAIIPMHFGLDSGVLAAAIATYLLDPSARASLARQPALSRST
jgi:hypothetical protein